MVECVVFDCLSDADNARLRELLQECVYELMTDAYELRDKIEAAMAKGE